MGTPQTVEERVPNIFRDGEPLGKDELDRVLLTFFEGTHVFKSVDDLRRHLERYRVHVRYPHGFFTLSARLAELIAEGRLQPLIFINCVRGGGAWEFLLSGSHGP